MVAQLYQQIHMGLDKTAPKIQVNGSYVQPPHWYNSDLSTLARKVKIAYKLMQKSNSRQHIAEYKSINDKYKKQCLTARRKNWNGFVADTSENSQITHLTKILQRKQNL